MTLPGNIAHLACRGVIAVTGRDATTFLQGLITNDMALLSTQPAIHAGLLSPQGKILFEFFVVQNFFAAPDGYLVDVARDQVAELAKRLKMYKLRAAVEVEDLSQGHAVFACWGVPFGDRLPPDIFPDPRLPELGTRWIVPLAEPGVADFLHGLPPVFAAAPESGFHAHRIAQGVPEGARDYPLADTFAHEANFDLLHGVSFTKGCYVGQEVVARMQHKTAVRKRVVRVMGAQPLVSGADIVLGEAAIGRIGSVCGDMALALLRLDRASEAAESGKTLTAGGVPITQIDPQAMARYRASASTRATPPAPL